VLYAQASAQAQAGAGGDGAEPAEDEVIEDADYEVVDDDEKATRS
jgi:hypothetical protein